MANLHQRCDDARDTSLIENNNGVAQEWGCNPAHCSHSPPQG